MLPPRNTPVADIDEDPNVEIRPYSSPPCYAQEVDPGYFGMPRRVDLDGLRRLERQLGEARNALDGAIERLARK